MIFRNASPNRYTVLPNETVRDANLSGDALGLLAFLLSHSDDWKITTRSLAGLNRFGSHDKVTKTLKSLREFGYAKLVRYPTGETQWDFSDTKNNFKPHSENQDMGKPHPEKPHPEKPHPENQDVYRKNNIKEITKDKNGGSQETDTKKKTSLNDDSVLPPAWKEKGKAYGMTEATIENEFGKFKNHHLEKKTRSESWIRQWDTWCRGWVTYGAKQVQSRTINLAPQQTSYWN